MASTTGHYDGLLVVDKPGYPSPNRPTSHDVVASVRRWSGQRRIGHTGTLDPMATGVLVLCLGRATRLVEYYQGHDKQYVAKIALGVATDTYDAAGRETASAPAPDLDVSALEHILDQFRGEITQTPPAFSAIKHEGEPLYRRARRGETVQPQPRKITIHRLELLDFAPGRSILLRVVSSAGAYMRSLASDIGVALGTYAHLAALRREAAGPFTLAQAHTLQEIERAASLGNLDSLLLPLGAGLALPKLYPDPDTMTQLGHGQPVVLPAAAFYDETAAELCDLIHLAQAVGPDGSLAGIIRRVESAETGEEGAAWRTVKWLQSP